MTEQVLTLIWARFIYECVKMFKYCHPYELFHIWFNKLKSKGFLASSVSTYAFYTLYATMPHNLIKDKTY